MHFQGRPLGAGVCRCDTGSLDGGNVHTRVSKKSVAASECEISQLVFSKTRLHPSRCYVLIKSSQTPVIL